MRCSTNKSQSQPRKDYFITGCRPVAVQECILQVIDTKKWIGRGRVLEASTEMGNLQGGSCQKMSIFSLSLRDPTV